MGKQGAERMIPDGNGACDSIIRIELITHFHRNPGMESTPACMAEAIGRDLSRVEEQLKKLVQLRILLEKPRGDEVYYRYLPPLSSSMGRRRGPHAIEMGEASLGIT